MERVYGRRRYLGEQRKPAEYRGVIKRIRGRIWEKQQEGKTTRGGRR